MVSVPFGTPEIFWTNGEKGTIARKHLRIAPQLGEEFVHNNIKYVVKRYSDKGIHVSIKKLKESKGNKKAKDKEKTTKGKEKTAQQEEVVDVQEEGVAVAEEVVAVAEEVVDVAEEGGKGKRKATETKQVCANTDYVFTLTLILQLH